MSDLEFREKAGEIVDNMISLPEGRLPYDGGSSGGLGFRNMDLGRFQATGTLAERSFMIPDNLVQDFLVNDIDRLSMSYIRQMVPTIALAEKFGDPTMTHVFKALREEHGRAASAATTEKERKALQKQLEADERDLAGMRDRIMGVYGHSSNTFARNAARAAGVARAWNYLSDMGGVVLYAMADSATGVFRHGLGTQLDGYVTALKTALADREVWKKFTTELHAMGIAVETKLSSRAHAMDDFSQTGLGNSRFARVLQAMQERFGNLNFNNPVTDFLKASNANIIMHRLIEAARNSEAGTASKKQIAYLAENNIAPEMAYRIARAFDEGGGESVNKVMLPNTADWRDGGARRAFEAAVQREVDIAVITPGQDKPLIFSHPVAGLLFQFKTFMAAANHRIAMANLQVQDARTLQGLVATTAAGMLSFAAYAALSGRDTSQMTINDWVKEGLSRGGALGWLDEGNGLVSKLSRGQLDLYRALGATPKEASRFESRTNFSALLGPTFGKLEAMYNVGSAAVSGNWNASDTRALRRAMAYENVFYLKLLFDQVEDAANNAFGIPVSPRS